LPRLILNPLMSAQKTPLRGRFFRLFAAPLSALAGLLAGLAWLAPNHYPPWTSFHSEAAAFAALVVLGVATLSARRWCPPPAALGVLVALVALIGLQFASGLIASRGDALLSSLYLAGFGLSLWLGCVVGAGEHRAPALAGFAAVLVAAACVSTYIALLQWLGRESTWGILAAERGPDMRPFGNFGQPNHLATLTLMGCAFAALLHVQRWLRPWQLWALLAWLSLGLTLSESRSGRLGALAMGLFLLWRSRERALRCLRRSVWAWWGLLVALGWGLPRLAEALLLQTGRSATMTRDGARTVMWAQMMDAIQQSPWWGYGWRQTIVAQKSAVLSHPGELATDYAHNLLLDVMLWVGVPLGLLLLGATGWWLFRLAQRARTMPDTLLAASVIPFLVHSQFEFPFAYAYFLFPVAWVLGLLKGQECALRPETLARPAWPRPVFAAVLLGFAGLCAAVAHEYLLAEEDYRVMRFELRKVGERPASYEAPRLVLLTQLDDLLRAGRMVPRAGMSESELELLRRVNQSQGWATLHLSYAVALALNGRPQEATLELQRLRALHGETSYRQALAHFTALRAQPGYEEALRAVETP
jgi:hypothetical protein